MNLNEKINKGMLILFEEQSEQLEQGRKAEQPIFLLKLDINKDVP
ncbi:hypothetical protein [Psychromonas sp. MB-3u-54]|nr:hypothetical protein [Psychromonas sp. MB-3u-54]